MDWPFFAGQYLHKGSHLYIEGKLNYRQYEGKDGLTKYITEIVADQIILLDKNSKEITPDLIEETDLPPPF